MIQTDCLIKLLVLIRDLWEVLNSSHFSQVTHNIEKKFFNLSISNMQLIIVIMGEIKHLIGYLRKPLH